jgi:aromatic ring-opening dioxygenase catalytic subunit (LigB family)
MGQVVLGIGTSHSPLLAIGADLWLERGKDDLRREQLFLSDGRVISYSELLHEVGGQYASSANYETFVGQASQAQKSLDRLATAIEDANLDAIVVVGDDQHELFDSRHIPAIAVYTGEFIDMHPRNEVHPDLPDWYRAANKGYQMDVPTRHQGESSLSLAIVHGLIAKGVDVSVSNEVQDPLKAGFGHAYGFVFDRLLGGRDTPCVPILLNTYYPPNVPTPARCYAVGRAICESIEQMPDSRRIAVIASGGLSHFAIDANFDRTFLASLSAKDRNALCSIPVPALRSGNSEILNWIMTAGSLESLRLQWSEYVPVYRTPAGTGIGLGFAIWR